MSTGALQDLLAPSTWPLFVLLTGRVGGLMLSAPLWSTPMLPRIVRAGLTVLLSAALLPAALDARPDAHYVALPLLLVGELLVGLGIGLAAAILVQGITFGGEVLAVQMGLGFGQAVNPMFQEETTGTGQLYGGLAILLYLAVGGHLMLVSGLADSLRVIPPGMALKMEFAPTAIVGMVTEFFSTALRAAAPVMGVLLLTNVALAILYRAVPQMNAILVAFPLTIGVGLIAFGACLPMLASSVLSWMQMIPEELANVIEAYRAMVAGG